MNSNLNIDIEKKRQDIKNMLFDGKKVNIDIYQKTQNNQCTIQNELNSSRFPELVLLNQVSNNRPVFWFHSVGSVQPYFRLAENVERPFYGIEARGLRTNRAPLYGIQALAAYYIHIITSIQSKGPYDLGGYSLGGLIAYEITRQLQELKERVSSITMLDTLDPGVSEATQDISYKSRLLQGVNHTLAASILQDPERRESLLIHREEIDWTMNEEEIIHCLSQLAISRGVLQTEEEMRTKILKMAELQTAYGYDSYIIKPLFKPEEVECYFFRNKNGILFGTLSPFFWVIEDEKKVDNLVYWKLWEKYLPKIQIMDINSSTHMMMLTEKRAYEPILEFCKQLYSEQGMTIKFLKGFIKKLEKNKKSTSK